MGARVPWGGTARVGAREGGTRVGTRGTGVHARRPTHAQPGHVGSNGLVLQLLLLVRPLPLGLLLLLERSRDRLL